MKPVDDLRPPDEMAGTNENLAGLRRLLEPWKCCGALNLCAGLCIETELSDSLARAHAAVAAEAARRSLPR